MCGGGSYGYPLSGRAAGGGSKQRSGVKRAGSAGRRDAGQRGRGQQLAGGVQQRRDHARRRTASCGELRRDRGLVRRGRPGQRRAGPRPVAAARRAADRLAGRAARAAGQRAWPTARQIAVSGTGSVLGVVGASAYGSSTRDVHHRLRGRQQQHGDRHAGRLGGHQRGGRHRPAGQHRRLEPGRNDPGQPVLRGHPADRRRPGDLGDAAHGRRRAWPRTCRPCTCSA